MKTFFKIEWSFCDGDMCVYIYEICVFYLNFPSILVFRTTTDMARSKTLEQLELFQCLWLDRLAQRSCLRIYPFQVLHNSQRIKYTPSYSTSNGYNNFITFVNKFMQDFLILVTTFLLYIFNIYLIFNCIKCNRCHPAKMHSEQSALNGPLSCHAPIGHYPFRHDPKPGDINIIIIITVIIVGRLAFPLGSRVGQGPLQKLTNF